jgi:hypothetical protein
MANTRTASKASNSRKAPAKPLADLSDEAEIARDVVDYLKEYAREKPEVAALWCLGIGFILGWKLKPW